MKALLNVFKAWKLNPIPQIATLSVLAGTFTVVAMVALIQKNMNGMLDRWGSEVKMHVYLKDDLSDSGREQIAKALEKTGYFQSTSYITKKIAAQNFRKKMGSLVPDFANDLDDDNPLPNSYEAILKSEMHHAAQYGKVTELAGQLAKLAGVEDVSYGQGWVENYASVLRVFSLSSAGLIVIVLCGSLFIVGNAIKSSISQRRDEIEIMELFGATHWTILKPFVLEGALLGGISSLAAIIISYSLFAWQSHLLTETMNFWNLEEVLRYFSMWQIFFFVFFGTTISALGSYIFVRQIGTGWAAAER